MRRRTRACLIALEMAPVARGENESTFKSCGNLFEIRNSTGAARGHVFVHKRSNRIFEV